MPRGDLQVEDLGHQPHVHAHLHRRLAPLEPPRQRRLPLDAHERLARPGLRLGGVGRVGELAERREDLVAGRAVLDGDVGRVRQAEQARQRAELMARAYDHWRVACVAVAPRGDIEHQVAGVARRVVAVPLRELDGSGKGQVGGKVVGREAKAARIVRHAAASVRRRVVRLEGLDIRFDVPRLGWALPGCRLGRALPGCGGGGGLWAGCSRCTRPRRLIFVRRDDDSVGPAFGVPLRTRGLLLDLNFFVGHLACRLRSRARAG